MKINDNMILWRKWHGHAQDINVTANQAQENHKKLKAQD